MQGLQPLLIQAIASMRESSASDLSMSPSSSSDCKGSNSHLPATNLQAAWLAELDEMRPPKTGTRSMQSTPPSEQLLPTARADLSASMGQSIVSNYIHQYGAKVTDDLGEWQATPAQGAIVFLSIVVFGGDRFPALLAQP